jgi:hypothetical protein
MVNGVEEFEQSCRERGLAFEALTPNGGSCAQIRFSGRFEQVPVVWHAEVMSLRHFRNTCQSETDGPSGQRQFIEVGEPGPQGRHIRIGLNVSTIDTPTLLKTMIMIRQWKNLHLGVHEFGEPVSANS